MDAFERLSDEELLAATRRDPEAFGARRHEKAMLVFFLRRTSGAEAAADLTAEVFAAALASSRRFRPGKAPAVAWFYGIANNKLASSRNRGTIEERARRRLEAEPLVLTDETIERVEALADAASMPRRRRRASFTCARAGGARGRPHHRTRRRARPRRRAQAGAGRQAATEVLRRRIRQGEVKPGEPLRIDALTKELGMSSTPVREALRTLEADGLVDYQPHRGATVSDSVGDDASMEEVFRMRLLLEPYACRLATERISDEQIAKLEQTHDSVLRAARSVHTSRSQVSERNSTWHFLLYAAAGMPLLSELIERLWDLMPWRTFWTVTATTSVSIEEHDAIMEAVRERDGDRAAELMSTHINHGLAYLETEREKGFEKF